METEGKAAWNNPNRLSGLKNVQLYFVDDTPTLALRFEGICAASDFLDLAENFGALGAENRRIKIEPDPCRVVIPGGDQEVDFGGITQALYAFIARDGKFNPFEKESLQHYLEDRQLHRLGILRGRNGTGRSLS